MPRGVNDRFLQILQHERKANVRTVATMMGLVPFAYFMAELTDDPLLGSIVLLAFLSLAAGAGLGIAYGHHRTKRYNASLRDSWNDWMRMSLSCNRVDEVARHVARKGHVAAIAGVGWASLLLANALLFAALWTGASWSVPFGASVTVANGIVLGTLAGLAIWRFRWASQFSRALDELITEGQVSLWGER